MNKKKEKEILHSKCIFDKNIEQKKMEFSKIHGKKIRRNRRCHIGNLNIYICSDQPKKNYETELDNISTTCSSSATNFTESEKIVNPKSGINFNNRLGKYNIFGPK